MTDQPETQMDEIRTRYASAIERFSKYYEPRGLMGLPHLNIGVQGFGLAHDTDSRRHDDQHREWLGIMLCAALERLFELEGETAQKNELERSASTVSDDKGDLQTIDERDAAEDAMSKAYSLVMGSAPVWSNLFGFSDALDQMEWTLKRERDHRAMVEKCGDAIGGFNRSTPDNQEGSGD